MFLSVLLCVGANEAERPALVNNHRPESMSRCFLFHLYKVLRLRLSQWHTSILVNCQFWSVAVLGLGRGGHRPPSFAPAPPVSWPPMFFLQR